MIVVTDATYWTGEVGNIPQRFLQIFVCFATGRARNFPKILVDVLPREVVEILATKSGWTAKSTSSLRPTDPLLHSGWAHVLFLLSTVWFGLVVSRPDAKWSFSLVDFPSVFIDFPEKS